MAESTEEIDCVLSKLILTPIPSWIHPGMLLERIVTYCSIAISGVIFPSCFHAFLAQNNSFLYQSATRFDISSN